MDQTIARVKNGKLYQSLEESNPINVGTSAWFDWLERHRAFHFFDPSGRFTAYKSDTDIEGQSWEASCTRNGKRAHIYLGQSHSLTLEALHAATLTLALESAMPDPTVLRQARSADSQSGLRKAKDKTRTPRSLLQTKIYRPYIGDDVIPRARLIRRLNAALDGKASLVCAPAGFGKTTLVAEWVQTIERPTAWLSLDEQDNTLEVFVGSLVAALQSVFPGAFTATSSLLSAPDVQHFPPPHRIAILVVNDLVALPEDIVLVLDDYHYIRHADVHALLEELISHLPPQAHLVLTSRFDPPLPLARWLAKGYLHTVRHADLRFRQEEIQAFLTHMLGEERANATVGALEEVTEGWIAVLRLAALSLLGTRDTTAFLERLRQCSDQSVSRYLLEEVFHQQTSLVQTVLEQLSILEQCCVELCVAVIGDAFTRQQVQAIMDDLVNSQIFLVPLDIHQGWYRFHHLFGELLQQRLRGRCSIEELATLHRRASTWYATHGLIDEAIRHALFAGDGPSASQLVEAHFHWAFEQEGWMQMERWLSVLPEDEVQRSPCLLLVRAWIMQTHGLLTELPPLLESAERLLVTVDSQWHDKADSLQRMLHAVMAIIRCQFQYFTGRASEALETAQRALRWIPPGEEYLAGLATMYLALSQQATGQEIVAIVTLQEALFEHATRPTSIARLLFSQAMVFLAAGKLHQVEHIAQYLLRLAQQADLAMSAAWAHWLLGLVQYEWNNLEVAISHFSIAIEHRYRVHAWTVQEAMYGLALAYQAQGLEIEAEKVTRDLLDFVQEEHSQRDLLVAYAFCGHLALLQDDVEVAEPWLLMAGKQEELVGPMTSLEVPPITLAWTLLAKGGEGDVARAQVLLTRLFEYARTIHSTRKTIQVLALQAWASALQSREAEALVALERALELARPGGFTRTFADLPALFSLLQQLYIPGVKQHTVNQKDGFLKRILVAMNPQAARAVFRKELLRQEGLEP